LFFVLTYFVEICLYKFDRHRALGCILFSFYLKVAFWDVRLIEFGKRFDFG